MCFLRQTGKEKRRTLRESLVLRVLKKVVFHLGTLRKKYNCAGTSLRTADAFPVVASLPPKNSLLFFGGREARTGNASAVQRLLRLCCSHAYLPFSEVFKQICSGCSIMLISDFMEQIRMLPYNLESNGRGFSRSKRSFLSGSGYLRIHVFQKCWGYL